MATQGYDLMAAIHPRKTSDTPLTLEYLIDIEHTYIVQMGIARLREGLSLTEGQERVFSI